MNVSRTVVLIGPSSTLKLRSQERKRSERRVERLIIFIWNFPLWTCSCILNRLNSRVWNRNWFQSVNLQFEKRKERGEIILFVSQSCLISDEIFWQKLQHMCELFIPVKMFVERQVFYFGLAGVFVFANEWWVGISNLSQYLRSKIHSSNRQTNHRAFAHLTLILNEIIPNLGSDSNCWNGWRSSHSCTVEDRSSDGKIR